MTEIYVFDEVVNLSV